MKLISILLSALAALFVCAGMAHADTRSIYTVTGIRVDVSAANSQEAEQRAIAEAKITGLRRLVSKLTLPEDRDRIGPDFYSIDNANRLASAYDVQDERRTTTLYRATLDVLYNPNGVRAALRRLGVPFVDQQASLSMIVPVVTDPPRLDLWRNAWPQSNKGALNPYVRGLSFYTSSDTWETFGREAGSVGARNAVIAELSGDEGAYRVRLVRETGSGSVTLGVTSPVATIPEAVSAASAYLDETWKRQSVIRSSVRTRSSATVRFEDMASWNLVRGALTASALISEFQVDALSSDGAVVSFAYAGSEDRLRSELGQRGVRLEKAGDDWVMTSALTQIR